MIPSLLVSNSCPRNVDMASSKFFLSYYVRASLGAKTEFRVDASRPVMYSESVPSCLSGNSTTMLVTAAWSKLKLDQILGAGLGAQEVPTLTLQTRPWKK